MRKIAITTECVADLPKAVLQKYEIDIIYFDIATEGGLFRDTDEVDANNIMEYMIDGKKKAQSVVPGANEFKNFFRKKLEDYDEVIHICIGAGISVTVENATMARTKLGIDGRRIHIIDSQSLSGGQGIIVLEACKCRDNGMSSEEIIAHIEQYKLRVQTTFLANNADYLYYNGKVSKAVMKLCKTLHLHPVLAMSEKGLALRWIYIGNYEKAGIRYMKKLLGKHHKIDTSTCMLVYAGCNHEMIEQIRTRMGEMVQFEHFLENTASATVSCNCGPLTYGILFAHKGE